MKKELLRVVWLTSIGLTCVALPYLWWPIPLGWKTTMHFALSTLFVGLVAFGFSSGKAFDERVSKKRAYLGVFCFSVVIIGSIAIYMALK